MLAINHRVILIYRSGFNAFKKSPLRMKGLYVHSGCKSEWWGVLEVFTEWGMKATNGSTVNSGSWLRASVRGWSETNASHLLSSLTTFDDDWSRNPMFALGSGMFANSRCNSNAPSLIRSLFKFTPCEAPKDPLKLQFRQSAQALQTYPILGFLNCTSANDDVVCLENVCAFSRDFYHVKVHLFQSSQGTQCVRTLKDEYFHPDL